MPPHQPHFLILALSGIGNLLMQLPTLKVVKEANPTTRITLWVAPRGTSALAQEVPYIDEVVEAPIQQSLAGHVALVHQLRRQKFTHGLMLHPGQLWKGAAYMLLSGCQQRIAHEYPFRGQPTSSFLLTHAIPLKENLHDLEQNLRLAEPLTGTKNIKWPTAYAFSPPKTHRDRAAAIAAEAQLNESVFTVGLHAGSAPHFSWKRWPLDQFAQLAATLIQNYSAHILIFGGPDEEAQKQELKALIEKQLLTTNYRVKRPVGRHAAFTGSLPTLVSADLVTTAAVMQHCQLFISNDSGLMHLAAAVGTPTVGLFGPTDETKTGPRGKKSHAIRAPHTSPAYDTNRNYSLGTAPHPTLLKLTPAHVLEQLKSFRLVP